MLKDFKEFISRGNVIDLAIGVIIGAAFGKIVSSMVSDVLMPPIGFILSGVDFSKMGIMLKEGSDGKEPVIFAYGRFIQSIIDFLIIALVIFLMIKAFNKFKQKKEAAEIPVITKQEELLTEIRDLLKSNSDKPLT